MAFCNSCGLEISSQAKFCDNCGAPVKSQVKEEQIKQVDKTLDLKEQQSYTPPAQQSYTPPAQQSHTPPAQQSYTPPAQQSYTPPARQSHTPPAQQSYTPPAQQSHTPPVQQSHTPSAQQAYVPPAQQSYTPPVQAAKQKKPIDKRLFIFGGAALAVVLIVVLLVSLIGGNDSVAASVNDPNVGVWNAVTAKAWGIELDIEDVYQKGFSIELLDKGKCELNVDGKKGSAKWTLKDDEITIKGGGFDLSGELKDGKMVIDDVMGTGIVVSFEKEGGYVAAGGSSPAQTSALQKQWNGTWYGVVDFIEGSGRYSFIPDSSDVYMVVDVDESGSGVFAVYFGSGLPAFASGSCTVSSHGLDAERGAVLDGDMYTYNWMFRVSPDYENKYVIRDDYTDFYGDYFEYTIFLKPWGANWDKEIQENQLLPPGYDDYSQKLKSGAPSPFDGLNPL
ncbi:MAG: zinc-ribbon domain-containing protein [Christensenellales bacterium]|jgi:hypothetical protein